MKKLDPILGKDHIILQREGHDPFMLTYEEVGMLGVLAIRRVTEERAQTARLIMERLGWTKDKEHAKRYGELAWVVTDGASTNFIAYDPSTGKTWGNLTTDDAAQARQKAARNALAHAGLITEKDRR